MAQTCFAAAAILTRWNCRQDVPNILTGHRDQHGRHATTDWLKALLTLSMVTFLRSQLEG